MNRFALFLAGVLFVLGGCVVAHPQPVTSAPMEQLRFPNGPTLAFENSMGLRMRKPAGAGLYYIDFSNESVNLRIALAHSWSDLSCGREPGCQEIVADTGLGRVSFALRKLSRRVSEADISASADAQPRYEYQALAMDKVSRGGSFLSVDIACATRQVCLNQIAALRSLRVVAA